MSHPSVSKDASAQSVPKSSLELADQSDHFENDIQVNLFSKFLQLQLITAMRTI